MEKTQNVQLRLLENRENATFMCAPNLTGTKTISGT